MNVGKAVGMPAPAAPVVGVIGVPWVSRVGSGGAVRVGGAVFVAVGGRDVAVGIDSCVSATMVKAAA